MVSLFRGNSAMPKLAEAIRMAPRNSNSAVPATTTGTAAGPQPAMRAIDSVDLMAGRRELLIRHGAEEYRLRLTGNNRLILTK